VLDLRGLRCPLPALKTAVRLKRMAPGADLEVLADDPLAALDLAHLCNADGHVLLAAEAADGHVRFRLRRGGGSAG
jgi:tRNA 2-thiouridine synthesizing protein A